MTLGTGFGNDLAFAPTSWTGCNVGKTAEHALVYLADLSGTVTVGAACRLTARLTADPLADRTVFGPVDRDLFLDTKGSFLESDTNPLEKVRSTLRRLARRSAGTPKESLKNIPDATHVETIEPLGEAAITASVSVPVVGSPFLRIGKDFLGFVDFFELILSLRIVVFIGVIFECQGPESFLYVFIGGISANAEDFIIITFFSHTLILKKGFIQTFIIPEMKITFTYYTWSLLGTTKQLAFETKPPHPEILRFTPLLMKSRQDDNIG
jgi:hypothetical protein